ncbi:MAG: hypothetical protein AMXMBFR4_29750 [Candidatus Hydrogenedentota bacterium]
MLWSYFLFMGLLITTLVLWAIVALKDDGYENSAPSSQAPEAKPEEQKDGP